MSDADTSGGGLDSARLSVRSSSDPPETPKNRQSQFGGDKPDFDNLEFNSGEPLRATVEEGDTRKLETCRDAIEGFEHYLEAKENQVLVLEDNNNGDILVLRHEHRWTPEYRKKIYAKLKDGEEYMKLKYGSGPNDTIPTTMITLTVDQKDKFGNWRPPVDVLEQLKDGWDKFRRVVDRMTEGRDTEYMQVVEPHQTGMCHMHIAVFGAALSGVREKLDNLWVDRYNPSAVKRGQHVRVEDGTSRTQDIESPASYLMKYLTKSMCRDGGEEQTSKELMPEVEGYKLFSAVLWATGLRQFSLSQELRRAIRAARGGDDTGSDRDWVFIGVSSGIPPGFYDGDSGVAGEIRDYMDGRRCAGKPVVKQHEQGELPHECDPYSDGSSQSSGVSQSEIVSEIIAVVQSNDEYGVGQVAASVCWEIDVLPDKVVRMIDKMLSEGRLIDVDDGLSLG